MRLAKFGFQLLESFLEHFRETVFDQIDLIHLHIQRLGYLWGPRFCRPICGTAKSRRRTQMCTIFGKPLRTKPFILRWL